MSRRVRILLARSASPLAIVTALILLAPAVALTATGAGAGKPVSIDKTEQRLISGIDTQNVVDLAYFVSQGREKVGGTDIDHQTAQLLESKFLEIGLKNVRMEEFYVDVNELVSADDIGYAVDGFTILTPSDAPLKELKTTIYNGCSGTGPDGITAELVDVGSGTREEIMAAGDVEGKILFVKRDDNVWLWNTMQVYEAEAWGAAAIVMYSVAGDWPLDEAVKQDSVGGNIPAFSISENDAAYVKSLMAEGCVTVRLYGEVDIYRSTAYNVVGEIPGYKHPDEYIVLMAHYDNWWISLNDDCTGIGAMIDIAQNLMDNYRNDRTILVIATSAEETGGLDGTWFNWLIGSAAFVNAHPELEDRIIGVLNLDVISADTQFWFDATPELREICDGVVKDLKIGNVHPWIQDTWQDSWVFAQVGYPAVHLWSWGLFYDYIYHTDMDTEVYTLPKSIEITEKVYLVLLHRLDSAKTLPYTFDETHAVVSGNIATLKTKAQSIPDPIDFSAVDAALARFDAANKALKDALGSAGTIDPPLADHVNALLLRATRMANSVSYEVGGHALWDVYYRGTEYVQAAGLMWNVADLLDKGKFDKAASSLTEYTTMFWGKLMSSESYAQMFDMIMTDRGWGEVCAVEFVNVYDLWASVMSKSQTGETADVSEEMEQVLLWYDWAVGKANHDMVVLAEGFDSAAADLEEAAALL